MENTHPFEAAMSEAPQTAATAPDNTDNASTDATVEHHFEFRGQTTEYFKIWIVNLLLSIITLTIFSAWAKVRSRRYFYGNTFLNGENFEYHAEPLSILFARIIVYLIVLGGAFWAGEDALDKAFHSSLLFLLLPLALARGFSFNARNSSHRGVRFSFQRAYGKIYLIYLPLIILVLLLNYFSLVLNELGDKIGQWVMESDNLMRLLGGFFLFLLVLLVIFPFFSRAIHGYKANHHAWGRLSLGFTPPPIRKYMIAYWLIPLFWFFISFINVMIVTALLLFYNDIAQESTGFITGLTAFIFFIMALVFSWLHSRAVLFHLFWNGVQTKEGCKMQCRFSALAFTVKILLVNLMANLLSLGLLYPWTKIRKSRYLAQHMSVIAPAGFLDSVVTARKEQESALGEEFDAVQGFDFDVGLI